MNALHLKIEQDTKIFVACAAYSGTGGAQLLHQLANTLRNNGFNAQMLYVNSRICSTIRRNPVHPELQAYQIPWTTSTKHSPNDVLICPEILPELLFHFRSARRIVWWLSVDNYFNALKWLNGIPATFPLLRRIYTINFSDQSLLHLAQSYYAKVYLEKQGVKRVALLSDFLMEEYITSPLNKATEKKSFVAFNPLKGFKFTQQLMAMAPDIEWKPIQGMSRAEVANLLRQAKVYIDFGSHPGKDRIPREAAIAGCCVITNTRGSAAFSEDLPIPSEYKFSDIAEAIPSILEKIRFCLRNYDTVASDFDDYRRFILSEKNRFITAVSEIFILHKQ